MREDAHRKGRLYTDSHADVAFRLLPRMDTLEQVRTVEVETGLSDGLNIEIEMME